MRPLGHDGTRAERVIEPLDTRLVEAWARMRACSSVDEDRMFRYATTLLGPIRPSVEQLHRLIIEEPPHEGFPATAFGIFISAGYGLQERDEIVYDLDTPHIDFLGSSIRKRLVIDGVVGNEAGSSMRGELIINGTVGNHAGRGMIGTCTLNGAAGKFLGVNLVGTLTIDDSAVYTKPQWEFIHGWGYEMIGTIIADERFRPLFPSYQGRYIAGGKARWTFEGRHDEFLRDVARAVDDTERPYVRWNMLNDEYQLYPEHDR
jgi:hypothetical protein